MRERKQPEVRRAELVAAAATLFAERGVTDTAVSDIVHSADVAQGTFYLYFESKDAIICAVVEALIHGVAGRIEEALSDTGLSPIEKLDAMVEALLEISDEPYEVELMAIFHRPDNLPIHDRVVRSLGERMTPHLTRIIEQGVAEGVFEAEEPTAAAWFVFGALHGLETGFSGVEETRAAIAQLRSFVLRGLGYRSTGVADVASSR
jgi:AcrR family transcriptional regulator